MLAKAKKIALSLSVIVLFALYALQQKARPPQVPPAVVAALATARPAVVVTRSATVTPTATRSPTVAPTAARPVATVPAPTPTTAPTAAATAPAAATVPASTAAASSAYRDGTYTGTQADANWGQVQVQVVISHGKISDVQFLDYPHDRGRSREINAMADPVLIQEAISAQQAQVDVVSGATDTSQAFIESLGSALQQANA